MILVPGMSFIGFLRKFNDTHSLKSGDLFWSLFEHILALHQLSHFNLKTVDLFLLVVSINAENVTRTHIIYIISITINFKDTISHSEIHK